MPDRPRLGISACLLGEAVRYDAGHKRDAFLVETLGPHVEWVPVCPEVEAGFGTPRDPMRLVRTADSTWAPSSAGARRKNPAKAGSHDSSVHLVVINSGEDVTDRLRLASRERLRLLDEANLSGYVLKKDSPSCGLEGVKVFTPEGAVTGAGRGLFADALIARFPSLPVEDEGHLSDPELREDFIARVFAYRHLRVPPELRRRHA